MSVIGSCKATCRATGNVFVGSLVSKGPHALACVGPHVGLQEMCVCDWFL